MAKGLRSKVLQRHRRLKRKVVNETIVTPRTAEFNRKMKEVDAGTYKEAVKKPNAFLYPDHPDAEIPIHKVEAAIDFRSDAIPNSGLACIGNRRRYTPEEKKMLGVPMTAADIDKAAEAARCEERLEREFGTKDGDDMMDGEDDKSGSRKLSRLKKLELQFLEKFRSDKIIRKGMGGRTKRRRK